MKARIIGGAAIAAATVSIALAGASPAEARAKTHRAPKATAEKHNCGGKNGCPAMSKTEEKPAAQTSEPSAAPAAGKPADAK